MSGFGHVADQIKRVDQNLRVGTGLDRFRRQMAAEGPCARHCVEQAEHVASYGMETNAACQFAPSSSLASPSVGAAVVSSEPAPSSSDSPGVQAPPCG